MIHYTPIDLENDIKATIHANGLNYDIEHRETKLIHYVMSYAIVLDTETLEIELWTNLAPQFGNIITDDELLMISTIRAFVKSFKQNT